ncbi:MAG: hypothetical protein WBC71_04530, partial [Salaquimonas sp.]
VIFMVLNILFHMTVVPWITARFLKIQFIEILSPMFVPMILAVLVGLVAKNTAVYLPSGIPAFWFTTVFAGTIFGCWFVFAFMGFIRMNTEKD